MIECRPELEGMLHVEGDPPVLKVCDGKEWIVTQEVVPHREELHGWEAARPNEPAIFLLMFVAFVIGVLTGRLFIPRARGYEPRPPTSPPWGGQTPRPPSEVR